MSLNFFKNVLKVQGEKVEEGMINLAVALDRDGAGEAAIKQKQDEHAQRITMLQEANASYRKEKEEADREQGLYDRYMNEAEAISKLLENPGDRDVNVLNADLAKILDKVEQRAPILAKEIQEATEAEVWMKEMQSAVDEISAELLGLRESIDKSKATLQQAELAADRERKKAEQAEVLAGLRKSGNKFDTALNAINNAAQKKQAEVEELKLKTQSLSKKPTDDVADILGKYSNVAPTSTESLTERLARLKR